MKKLLIGLAFLSGCTPSFEDKVAAQFQMFAKAHNALEARVEALDHMRANAEASKIRAAEKKEAKK